MATIPIADARPATIVLAGREDRRSPPVTALRRFRFDVSAAERADRAMDRHLHAVAPSRQRR
jgi:hypothetical protein